MVDVDGSFWGLVEKGTVGMSEWERKQFNFRN